jgi:hypothetical protein
MSSMSFTISGGGTNVQVTVTEVAGDLVFDVKVVPGATGIIGDLRGLFFHLADESLLPGLTATGAKVTDQQFNANAVHDLGNGANMNGAGGR